MAVYEYCENGDLSSFLKRHPTKCRDMAFLRQLTINISSAAAALHKAGFVHCDIKPENILVDRLGQPRLADFGLSQAFSDVMIAQGTPSYLAPEVVSAWFNPEDGHNFEDKIDVFSIGVMLLYIISGRYPIRRISRRLQKGISFSRRELAEVFVPSEKCFSSVSKLSPELAEIIRLCVAQDAYDRPSASYLLKMAKEL